MCSEFLAVYIDRNRSWLEGSGDKKEIPSHVNNSIYFLSLITFTVSHIMELRTAEWSILNNEEREKK